MHMDGITRGKATRQRLHCIYKLVERRMEKKEREKGKKGQNEDESINMT